MKDVPFGTVKELKKNIKADIDGVYIFSHS
jgi:uncharacterized protein YbaA (DUF1428 family)